MKTHTMTFRTIVFYIPLYSILLYNCNGFNVDTVNIDMFKGNSGSQFGYSSVLHTNNDGSWILVGAPTDNMTSFQFLKTPGNVYKCKLLQSSKSCEAFIIRTSESTKPASSTRYEEDNQFLGSSIVRTKNKITVCAQKWKNMNEVVTINVEKPVGRCHDISHDLLSVTTNKIITYSSYYYNGYSYAMAMIGTVAIPTDVDDQVIVGGPGLFDERGGFLVYDASKTTNFYQTYSAFTNTAELYDVLLSGSEMAYSVGVGKFGNVLDCSTTPVVAGIPHYANTDSGHVGSFIILCATSGTSLQVLKQYIGTKIGSAFGMALAVADVNNDGHKDLLVGAPLQSVVQYDEGAVFVYYGTGDARYFQDAVQQLFGKKESSGRFGAAIVNVGDLNKDNIDDIAIGAPYEDDGYGAVYIFNGKSNQINSVHSQRISSKTLFTGIKSFGTYISLPLDVDGNQYADFAVGAYQSDATFIMRTNPVITMTARIDFETTQIPLTSQGLMCASQSNSNPCVTVTVCFSYTGTAVPTTTKVAYSLQADTLLTDQGKSRRVDLYKEGTNHKGTYNSVPITVSSIGQTCDSVYARVVATSRDFFDEIKTPLNLQGQFKLAELSTVGQIRPVLNNNKPATMEGAAVFQSGCLGVCAPDLRVDIVKDKNSILYGDTTEYSVTVSIVNSGEPAFGVRTYMYIDTNNARFLSATTLSDRGSVPITCSEGKDSKNKTAVVCDNTNVLFQRQLGIFQLRYNVSTAALSYNVTNYADLMTFVKFTAKTSAVGNEISVGDNTYTVTQDITFSANIEISGVSSPELIRTTESKNQTRPFQHSYSIYNAGPSPLFRGKTYFLIPAISDEVKIMVQPNNFSVSSKDSRSNCSIIIVPGILLGSDTPDLTPRQNDAGYVTRRAECASLTDPRCIVIECKIEILEPTVQTLINIYFSVYEQSLNIDTTPEFQFYTTSIIYPVITNMPNSLKSNTTTMIASYIYPNSLHSADAVNVWVIVGSVIGALILFAVLGFLLWKCGFFKRDKKEKLIKWKEETNFYEKRRTQAISDSTRPGQIQKTS